MAVTKKEALEGLPDLAGPTADVTVGEIVSQVRRTAPAIAVPAGIERFGDVRIRNLGVLPATVRSFLAGWLQSQQFCGGPPAEWAHLFAVAPDLDAMYPGSFRGEFGPVFFRGRLDGTARLLVVGQDPSSDEQLARRAFVGFSGQRLQRLLRKIGLARSYVIVNTFHWCVYGTYSSNPVLREAIEHADVVGWRNTVLDHIVATNPIDAVLTIGSPAKSAVVDLWPGATAFTASPSRIVSIWHPSAPSPGPLLASWNAGLDQLVDLVTPDITPDPAHYGTDWTDDDHLPIPRRDLPFGMPGWHGSGGSTRSRRLSPTSIEWSSA